LCRAASISADGRDLDKALDPGIAAGGGNPRGCVGLKILKGLRPSIVFGTPTRLITASAP
jgi:hypothetical protein